MGKEGRERKGVRPAHFLDASAAYAVTGGVGGMPRQQVIRWWSEKLTDETDS